MTRRTVHCVLLSLFLLPGLAFSADFFVDPLQGDMSNDGSAERPWRSIQEVVDRGLVQSRCWENLPYSEGANLLAKNPGAAVRPGDTIYLRSGFHGALSIESHYNTDFITIAAQEGHIPKLSRIRIRSSSHWARCGLHVSPAFSPSFERGTIIDLDSHGFRGPVHDIVVDQCQVQSTEDASEWNGQQWNTLSCNGIDADGKGITIRNSRFRNVNFGISVSASDSLVENNTVENFSGDGMRGLGDRSTFQYNTVRNCYDVNANHDDGFQSWSRGDDRRVGTGQVVGIVLRGNRIINFDDPNQPHRGALQGIGCFDGTFVDWVVENNVIITDHYHGITLSGAVGCRIVNNTVIDPNDRRPGPAAVRIGKHKNATPPAGCVVRNNLTAALHVSEGRNMTVDHNLIIKDPAAMFVDTAAGDLRLRENSPAVDAGSPELAPSRDLAGVPRPQGRGVDIGAYEYDVGDAR